MKIIMATTHVQDHYLTPEVSLCTICLEKFKSPVSLHCSHSFCRNCLSTYIKSSCGNCVTPLGFPCPLCRVFIPAPGKINQYSVDEWATQLPENKFLTSVKDGRFILCKPCKEDGDEAKADGWCKDCSEALCQECIKYHKKSRPSRQHIVISFTEWSSDHQMQPLSVELCESHDGRKLEFFCEKHSIPCCSVCATIDHSNCTSFCQLEEVDGHIIAPEKIKVLESEMNKFCSKVEKIIVDEKTNIKCIDEVSDKYTNEITEFTTNVIQAVKKWREEHLDEVSKLSKESKFKLQTVAESFEQRLLYLKYWRESLVKNLSNENTSKTKRVLSYTKLKNIHENLQKLGFTKLKICIQTKPLDNVNLLTNSLSTLARMPAGEHLKQVVLHVDEIDYTNAKLKPISSFHLQDVAIKGGDILNDGNLFLAASYKCIICNINGEVLKEIKLPGSPWGVCTNGENEVLITLPCEKSILKFDSGSFEIKKTAPIDCYCYGIATTGNTTVIGTRKSVEIFYDDLNVTKRRTLLSDLHSTDDVAIDDEKNVIFSSYTQHFVKKLDTLGNVLFTYSHEELKSPYGLAVDKEGRVFVNGKESDNVHILARNGELLKILKGVSSPTWIKFQNGRNRLFIGNLSGNVKIFDIIEE